MTTTTKVLIGLLLLSLAFNGWCVWSTRTQERPVPRDATEAEVREDQPDPDGQGVLEDLVEGTEREADEHDTAAGAASGQVAAFCRAAGWAPPGSQNGRRMAGEGSGAPSTPRDRAAEALEDAGPPVGGEWRAPEPQPAPPVDSAMAMPERLEEEVITGRTPSAAERLAAPTFPEALALRDGTLSLWLVTPWGSLDRVRWEGVHDPMEARVRPDGSWFVRSSPWWWVDEAAGLAACAAGGVGSALVSRETQSDLLTFAPVAVGCAVGVRLVIW